MERSRDAYREKLNRLLELSTLQRYFIKENRIDELLLCQAEREGLFSSIPGPGAHREDTELRSLADRVLENDRLLMDEVKTLMGALSSKCGQLRAGRSALRAYSQTAVKRTVDL